MRFNFFIKIFYFISILFFVSFFFIKKKKLGSSFFFSVKTDLTERKKEDFMKIINFSKEVCDENHYNSFKCLKLLEIYVSPFLCIHDIQNDFTSGVISKYGIKEKEIIQFLLDYLVMNPESLFFDIGSHVGLYSVYAAKLGAFVVAVEAFQENIFRLHRSVKINNLTENIFLLNNAISNKNGLSVEIKHHKNIGEQSILGQKQSLNEINSNSVKTIIFDDLIGIIEKLPNKDKNYNAVMKIDIEGFEPYAFQNAEKLFVKLDFGLIIMEWHQIKKNSKKYVKEIEKMIAFFTQKGFVPYANRMILQTNNWINWPFDILWLKKKK